MAVLIIRGGDRSFRWAFALMMIATAIDATDGWLARKAHVKEVLPGFDGRALDDLIDFHTYTTLPLLLLWRAGVLSAGLSWILLLPLLASAYGFSQVNAKTDDGFFLGFPSYWNIIAFYVYILRPEPLVSALILVSFALLTFVTQPVRVRDAWRAILDGDQPRRADLVRDARRGLIRYRAARGGHRASVAVLSSHLPRAVGARNAPAWPDAHEIRSSEAKAMNASAFLFLHRIIPVRGRDVNVRCR